ncbi:MAG TPA: transcriptional regulator [Ignavibacteriaceae bacterium]|nr:transcriptional regulator [Ignavibacteriaceae bacterium]
MSEFDYQQLDDLIHSRIRLAIMALLISVVEADFVFLKEKVNATDGNLSVHLKKLEDAGYINVKKEFINRKPRTMYSLSKIGRKAFEAYLDNLEKMIKK